jgi:hypothetical protein
MGERPRIQASKLFSTHLLSGVRSGGHHEGIISLQAAFRRGMRLVIGTRRWCHQPAVAGHANEQCYNGGAAHARTGRPFIAERCWSGRTGLPAKQLHPKRVSGVRIPPSPPNSQYQDDGISGNSAARGSGVWPAMKNPSSIPSKPFVTNGSQRGSLVSSPCRRRPTDPSN